MEFQIFFELTSDLGSLFIVLWMSYITEKACMKTEQKKIVGAEIHLRHVIVRTPKNTKISKMFTYVLFL